MMTASVILSHMCYSKGRRAQVLTEAFCISTRHSLTQHHYTADFTHARLCKYYRRMGFKVVREVGANGISDLPHQLVWGGVGTRMDADTVSFLRRWSKSIRTRRA
jgi:hypothetical protein